LWPRSNGEAEHRNRPEQKCDVGRRLPGRGNALEVIEHGADGSESAETDDGQRQRIGPPHGHRCTDCDSEDEDRQRPGQLGGCEVGEWHRLDLTG
jgi:hypothetical protein